MEIEQAEKKDTAAGEGHHTVPCPGDGVSRLPAEDTQAIEDPRGGNHAIPHPWRVSVPPMTEDPREIATGRLDRAIIIIMSDGGPSGGEPLSTRPGGDDRRHR